jgi:hypothetical protein
MDHRAMELTLRRMAKDFLPYRIDQRLLLPPDMRDWLPEGHLALFVDDLVEQLDRSAIYAVYESADDRGRRGLSPGHEGQTARVRVWRGQAFVAKDRAGHLRRSRVSGALGRSASRSRRHLGFPQAVPPDRQSHGKPCMGGTLPERASTTDWMRYKLRTAIAAALYRMRKAIVEPMFGQIKGVRNLRRFFLRGLPNVRHEFRFIALTHNILKLHRYRAAHALGPGQ